MGSWNNEVRIFEVGQGGINQGKASYSHEGQWAAVGAVGANRRVGASAHVEMLVWNRSGAVHRLGEGKPDHPLVRLRHKLTNQ